MPGHISSPSFRMSRVHVSIVGWLRHLESGLNHDPNVRNICTDHCATQVYIRIWWVERDIATRISWQNAQKKESQQIWLEIPKDHSNGEAWLWMSDSTIQNVIVTQETSACLKSSKRTTLVMISFFFFFVLRELPRQVKALVRLQHLLALCSVKL